MKTTTSLINLYTFIVVACILLVFAGGKSMAVTVVFGPGGLTNLVVNVPTNEMMIVRTASLDEFDFGPYITSGGVSYTPNGEFSTFDTSLQSRYLAGPCTFTFTNSEMFEDSVFDYDIVPCSGIETLVATNTPVIQVPDGERLDVLDGSYPVNLVVTLTNGASSQVSLCPPTLQSQDATASGICNPQGFEIAGPLTVTLYGDSQPPNSNTSPFYLTYFFASDVVQVAGPAIQSPVGSLVTVEESTDLQTWYPTYVSTQTSAPKTFYRLQVAQ